MKGRIVLKELNRLRGLGVITDEVYQSIEGYYASQGDNKKSFFNFFITTGCLLIGLGIILLFAYNWSKIGRGIKTGILVSSVLTGQIFLYFSLKKKREFVSGAGVFLILMVGLSIAMVSQMYNISGEDQGFYLAWATLSIPVLYFTKGGINTLVYGFVLYMYQSSDGNILIYLLLGVPIFFFSRKKDGMVVLVEITSKILFLIGFMTWYGEFSDNSRAGLLLYSALFAGAYTLPLGLKKIAEQLTIIMAYFLTFKKDYLFDNELVYDKVFWFSALFYIVVLALLFIRKEDIKNIILWNMPLIILPLFFSWSFIVYNIYFLIIGGNFIYEGFKRGDVRTFNNGSLIVGGLIATRFFDYKISTLTRGVVFILLGGALIAGNLYMSKKRGGSVEE